MGLVAGKLTLAQTRVLIPQMVLVFRPYEAQDREIHFFLKERPGCHLVGCLTGRLKPVGRSMVLGHLIGLG